MLTNKLEDLAGMEAKTVLDPSAGPQMRERDPGVLSVPHDRGDSAKGEYAKQQI